VAATAPQEYDYVFKLVLIGDSGVGKSCLLLRFCDRRFRMDHEATVGVEFGCRVLESQGFRFKVHGWDTAGQELYRSVTRSYYRFSAVVLLVFDVTQRATFEHLHTWLEEVRASSSAELALVGNKTDLREQRCVSREEAEAFAEKIGALYFETSALRDRGVTEAFVEPCVRAIRSLLSSGEGASRVQRMPRPLLPPQDGDTPWSACC
jgi:Ras-related protein Rab-2A